MRQQASFDEHGKITFEEIHFKPVDTGHLQGAMFTDRLDLWKRKAKKRILKAIDQGDMDAMWQAYADYEKGGD